MTIKDDSVKISWLALGDSYTIGQGVNATERFPTQTLNLLKQRQMPYNVTPTHIPDLLILEPKVFGDARGFFFER